MKKAIFILTLAISFACNAQRYSTKWSENDLPKYGFVSVIIDARHAVLGSEQTDDNPSLDFTAQIGANYHGWEIGIEYENHSALKPTFNRYGAFVMYGGEFMRDFSFYAGGGFGSIMREGNSNFFSFDFRNEVRYNLTDWVNICLVADIRSRKDISFYTGKEETQYRLNAGVKLQFKL